jgi:creatinine amidohydrolase
MELKDANWAAIEAYLETDDRVVIPLGSTEQHAYLSLATDSILAERVSIEAARPLGIPVCPVLSYGITPYFLAYPGTVSLRTETYRLVLHDMMDSLHQQGFRRFILVNGHGGNAPAREIGAEWSIAHPGSGVTLHDWWRAPLTWAAVAAADPVASHASWMENFPWTRLPGVTLPTAGKPAVDITPLRSLGAGAVRTALEDGSFGGVYARPDAEMLGIWQVAVEETRAVMAACGTATLS